MSVENPKTEAEWQAQSDAFTLAESEVIKADEQRHKKAQDAAAKMAEDQRERAAAMSKVAKKGNRTVRKPQGSSVAFQHLFTNVKKV